MIFKPTRFAGAWLLEIEPRRDERGFFARTWCRRECAEYALVIDIVQESLSFNERRGALRGLHFQRAPHQEIKVVSCIRARRGVKGRNETFGVNAR